jgi:predicted AAA+ superfamily ATPase
LRDSGLVHALLGLQNLDSVLSHPVAGASWEGFVIEQLINAAAPAVSRGFYLAAADVGASRKILVAPVDRAFPMRDGVEVMNPLMAANMVAAQV